MNYNTTSLNYRGCQTQPSRPFPKITLFCNFFRCELFGLGFKIILDCLPLQIFKISRLFGFYLGFFQPSQSPPVTDHLLLIISYQFTALDPKCPIHPHLAMLAMWTLGPSPPLPDNVWTSWKTINFLIPP